MLYCPIQTKTVTAEGCYAKNRPVLGERQAEWRCAHLLPSHAHIRHYLLCENSSRRQNDFSECTDDVSED